MFFHKFVRSLITLTQHILIKYYFKQVIQHNYLELYKNGSCDTLTNCLSCLTDTLCGWCEATGTCYLKVDADAVCKNSDGNSFLITQPSSCTVCSDYLDCKQCTKVSYIV